MPRKSSRGKKKGGRSNNASSNRPTIDVSGMLAGLGLPVPRLPFLIGSSNNLGASRSVYPRVDLSIPIIPSFAAIVAGGLTTVLSISASAALIENWAAFSALFGEFCLVGFTLEFRMNNVVTPAGLILIYVDEKSAAAPTFVNAASAPHLDILVSQTESPSKHLVSWKARDLADLQWTSTAATELPVWVKLFAAVASTGTAAGTTGTVQITGAVQVSFRGYVN